MISLTSTPHAEQSGRRHGRSLAFSANHSVSTRASTFIADRS
jgi:hypothetical protein